eukprot:s640_g25.t1
MGCSAGVHLDEGVSSTSTGGSWTPKSETSLREPRRKTPEEVLEVVLRSQQRFGSRGTERGVILSGGRC